MRFSLSIAAVFITMHLAAQFTAFEKYYSDTTSIDCHSLARDVDGGYIMAGTVRVGNSYDAAVYKTDSAGNLLWTRTYGDAFDEFGADVRAVSAGGYILVATKETSPTTKYVVATRLTPGGLILWQKVYAGGGMEEVTGVEPTYDAGFLITGNSASYGIPGAHILKIYSNGQVHWRKVFRGSHGATQCKAKEIPLGGYIVTTRLNDSVNVATNDILVMRLNPTGDTIWTLTFGGTANDEPTDVEVCSDGTFIASGATASYGAGNSDIFLAKISAGGQLLWTKTYGGSGEELSFDADQTSDGGYIIAGWTNSFGFGNADALLIKTDVNGDTLWTSVQGTPGANYGYATIESQNSNFLIAGFGEVVSGNNFSVFLNSVNTNVTTGCSTRASGLQVTSPNLPLSYLPVSWYAPAGYANTLFTAGTKALTTSSPCVTGVSEFIEIHVSVYPNPANDHLEIRTNRSLNLIMIFDSQGHKVLEDQNADHVIDISAFSAGIYTLCLVSNDVTFNTRFIKK